MIAAAVAYCENITGRAFGLKEVTVTGDGSEMARLPITPVNSVTSVKRIDPDGDHEVTDYTVTDMGIHLPDGKYEIAYIAGYNECPAQVRQAMLLLIGHWYDNRSSVLVGTTSAKLEMATDLLLRAYKAWWF